MEYVLKNVAYVHYSFKTHMLWNFDYTHLIYIITTIFFLRFSDAHKLFTGGGVDSVHCLIVSAQTKYIIHAYAFFLIENKSICEYDLITNNDTGVSIIN